MCVCVRVSNLVSIFPETVSDRVIVVMRRSLPGVSFLKGRMVVYTHTCRPLSHTGVRCIQTIILALPSSHFPLHASNDLHKTRQSHHHDTCMLKQQLSLSWGRHLFLIGDQLQAQKNARFQVGVNVAQWCPSEHLTPVLVSITNRHHATLFRLTARV